MADLKKKKRRLDAPSSYFAEDITQPEPESVSAPSVVREGPRTRERSTMGLLTFRVYARTLPKKLDAYAAFHAWYVGLLLPAKQTRDEWADKLAEFNARHVGK